MRTRLAFVVLCGLLAVSCARVDPIEGLAGEWYGKMQISPGVGDTTVQMFETKGDKVGNDQVGFRFRVASATGGDLCQVKIRRESAGKHFISIGWYQDIEIGEVPLERDWGSYYGRFTSQSGRFAGTQTASVVPFENGYVLRLAASDRQRGPLISYVIRLSRTKLRPMDKFE